jgi:hypothetical protein
MLVQASCHQENGSERRGEQRTQVLEMFKT